MNFNVIRILNSEICRHHLSGVLWSCWHTFLIFSGSICAPCYLLSTCWWGFFWFIDHFAPDWHFLVWCLLTEVFCLYSSVCFCPGLQCSLLVASGINLCYLDLFTLVGCFHIAFSSLFVCLA